MSLPVQQYFLVQTTKDSPEFIWERPLLSYDPASSNPEEARTHYRRLEYHHNKSWRFNANIAATDIYARIRQVSYQIKLLRFHWCSSTRARATLKLVVCHKVELLVFVAIPKKYLLSREIKLPFQTRASGNILHISCPIS